MSLGAKTANKGGTKSGGHQTQAKHNHVHKGTDKSQRAGRAAAEAGGGDEMQHHVNVLIEMTCRSEEEVCSALHDCDNDLNKACEMLLEAKDHIQSQWQTNEKKKKKSSNAGNAVQTLANIERDTEDWNSPGGDKSGNTTQSGGTGTGPHSVPREHRPPMRGRSSGRPYRGRGGESHIPSDDGEMGNRGIGPRRGPMGRGGGRGGGRGSSRGGRGSRPPRAPRHPQQSDQCWDMTPNISHQDQPMDGWGDTFPSPEDWDNEEWSGSLADTKVFTPSSATSAEVAPVTNVSELSSAQINSVSDQSTIHNTSLNSLQQDTSDYTKQSNAVLGTETSASSSPSLPPSIPQDPAIYAYTNPSHHLPKAQSPVAINVTGTLSAAQSQYLSQLTQKSDALKQERVMLNPQVFNSNYGVYGAADLANQRKPVQRARVPPPSKIPSSAVEMPGDLGSSSIGILDVQFGALDLASEALPFLTDNVSNATSNAVTNADKYNTVPSVMDHSLSDSGSGSVSIQQNVSLDSHQSSNTSSSLTNDVSAYSNNTPRSNQMLSSDSLSATVSEQNVAGPGAQYGSGVSRATPNVSAQHVPQLTTVAGLESQLTGKSSGVSDLSSQQSYSTYPGQATQYGVSQPTKQTYHPTHHGYPANPYSQVNSSGTSFTAPSSIASANAYAPTNTLNQYQHTQPLNTYQTPSSVSVYGNSLYTPSSVPYNSYQTSNKITSNVKDSQYDNAVTSANNSLANSQSTQSSSSKISTTSGKSSVSSSTSVMNSGSAGAGHVNTVMGQYMTIGQPFYAQPAYTYEELQLMQQRLPHHLVNPGYYDVGYGGGGGGAGAGTRDTPLASFSSLGAGAEARFGRAEAPSPQAVAAGGAGAGAAQPPQAGMAPYAYYYSGSMLPAGSFQPYSTQPLYPIATAGSTGSSSYGGGKGVVGGAGTYVGGAGGVAAAYGAPAPAAAPPPQAYEAVQQQQPAQQLNSHQDYKSGGGYTSSQQSSGVKQGVSNSNTATNDLNNTMYGGKGHVSLSKVNSYDKAYHSATPPPPFGLNAAAGGVAGVGAGVYPGPQMYIPHAAMPPPPQQHQMDGRVNSNHRRDNGTNNARGGASSQSKQGGGAKQGYSTSYWAPN